MTCKALRDVAELELANKGMVLPRWKRRTGPLRRGEKTWAVGEFVWKYSTAFDVIKGWRFNDNLGVIANHLAQCPFYSKYEHREELQVTYKRHVSQISKASASNYNATS